jgi:Tol biopolymer transport system component/dienelactone hydrolase
VKKKTFTKAMMKLIRNKKHVFSMSKTKTDPLPLEELMSLPSYVMPTLSYDKSKLAYYWDKTGRLELYIMDLATKETSQISHGEIPRSPRTGFIWDRKEEFIFFGRDEGGNEQNNIWRISVDGEAKELTQTPESQEHVGEISHDNKWLTFMSTRNGQMNVFKMQLDGSEIKQLSASDVPVTGGEWSPDDNWIIMTTNELKTNLENNDIYLYNVQTDELQRVIRMSEEGSHEYFSDWAPDSKSFTFSSDESGLNQVGIYDLASKEIAWISDGTADERGGTYNPSGTKVLVLRNHEATVKPIIYNLDDGSQQELKIPEGLAYGSEFIDDDTIMINFQSTTKRAEVWKYNLADDSYEVLLEAEYGSIDPKRFIEPEYIKYKSFDGLEIPAIVYKPQKIPKGETIPAIVNVHGGPTGQYFLSFNPMGQYIASEGFAVIYPNVRGSTGYGVEFRDACIKDWGGKDLKDVVHAAKYLASQSDVNKDRIAVAGGSYGGFMTYLAVTKEPEYWKAGFAWIGISELFSFYEESMPHFKYFINRQMGNPVDDKELWYDRSAVNFADKMTAKLMILHGVTDPRCPISQARIFRDKLLELGRKEDEDFEYVEIEEVGHGGWGDIKTRIFSVKKMIDFFKRVL